MILDFTDTNPPAQVLGYNVYRAGQPQPPPATWLLVGSEVTDDDPAMPNIQWTESAGGIPPLGGVYFYRVAAANHACGTQGPL
jgi:hypothetical protein